MNNRLYQVGVSFAKLGFTAFGGPAAAIAMMRQEFVLKRKWLSEEEFLDFVGISNLIPGPNATELAIHIGYKHAGWPGLVMAGTCYILPAMFIVLGFAWGYREFGTLLSLEGVLYGIKPVVIAILLHALWGMLKSRLRLSLGLGISIIVLAAYLSGVSPLPLLLGGGIVLGVLNLIKNKEDFPYHFGGIFQLLFILPESAASAVSFSFLRLFWVFLKAGAMMYGSGYVLLAFIQKDLVEKLGWLNRGQLLDAIAVGQVTPGPLATTATFVGFITGGLSGAFLATFAMFLPGFIFVAITHSFLYKLRESKTGNGFLDGVIYASLGLWAGVTWEIIDVALVDPMTIVISLFSLVMLFGFGLDSIWLILTGGLIGWLTGLIGG
ncbi:MAG: chromate efflux transporter [Chloroflexota bacterium]|nr:chromate efflux transporter [Chloroflexota bacterium]